LRGEGADAGWARRTPRGATHAFIEHERLTGDAESSPRVVRRGFQLIIGLGAIRSFDIKQSW
jgi:hypothetical protein